MAHFNNMKYFENDPVAVVRKCSELRDIEIMGLVCSWLAYGNRKQIFKHCNDSYELMRGKPYEYLMSEDWREFEDDKRCFYRLFTYQDFFSLMNVLFALYNNYETMQDAVLYIISIERCSYIDALIMLLPSKGIPKNSTSACKRLSLFLRWMVRDDGIVDLGVWKSLDKSKLLIPLDVHVNRVAREAGLISRNIADMKCVQQLSKSCAIFSPDDPARMDFALFGMGYSEKNHLD